MSGLGVEREKRMTRDNEKGITLCDVCDGMVLREKKKGITPK